MNNPKMRLTPKQTEVIHHLKEGGELVPVIPTDVKARRYYMLRSGTCEIIMREVPRKVVNNLRKKQQIQRVESGGRFKYVTPTENPATTTHEAVQLSFDSVNETQYTIPNRPDRIYNSDL